MTVDPLRLKELRRSYPELFPLQDPEPCDDCPAGINYILGFDGVRRCRNCTAALIEEKGWDWLPEAIEPQPIRVIRDWKIEAARLVRELALALPYFTTDEVWAEMPDDSARFADSRAMGSIMREAQAEQIIEITDRTKPSKRMESKGRKVRIWKSLVYEGEWMEEDDDDGQGRLI